MRKRLYLVLALGGIALTASAVFFGASRWRTSEGQDLAPEEARAVRSVPAVAVGNSVIPAKAQRSRSSGEAETVASPSDFPSLSSGQDKESSLANAILSIPVEDLSRMEPQIYAMREPSAKMQAISNYVERLFQVDQKQAAQWVLNAPADVRESGTYQLVSLWYAADPVKLLEWVYDVHSGANRDLVLEALVQRLKSSDLRNAVQFAYEISDATKRGNILRELGVRPVK